VFLHFFIAPTIITHIIAQEKRLLQKNCENQHFGYNPGHNKPLQRKNSYAGSDSAG
jgi:hypothetical protein